MSGIQGIAAVGVEGCVSLRLPLPYSTCGLQGVAVLELEVQPQALTPDFLSNRTAEVSPKLSAAIHGKLLQAGMLDVSGFLIEDPRSALWGGAVLRCAALHRAVPLPLDNCVGAAC